MPRLDYGADSTSRLVGRLPNPGGRWQEMFRVFFVGLAWKDHFTIPNALSKTNKSSMKNGDLGDNPFLLVAKGLCFFGGVFSN